MLLFKFGIECGLFKSQGIRAGLFYHLFISGGFGLELGCLMPLFISGGFGLELGCVMPLFISGGFGLGLGCVMPFSTISQFIMAVNFIDVFIAVLSLRSHCSETMNA